MSWEIKEQTCFFCSFNVEFGVKYRVTQSVSHFSGECFDYHAPSGGFAKAINILVLSGNPAKGRARSPDVEVEYHRRILLSKELQLAVTPYFFIYSHSLLEAKRKRAGWQRCRGQQP